MYERGRRRKEHVSIVACSYCLQKKNGVTLCEFLLNLFCPTAGQRYAMGSHSLPLFPFAVISSQPQFLVLSLIYIYHALYYYPNIMLNTTIHGT